MSRILLIQVRHDTAANWTSANPTLSLGEPGLESDTKKIKYGDGSTAWSSLPYFNFAPRVNSTASSATPSINTNTTDLFEITALAAAITSMTTNLTGSPSDGQKLIIRIKDNGTARAITWGASFSSSGVATLLATTIVNKQHTVGLVWDANVSKWVCLAVDATGY